MMFERVYIDGSGTRLVQWSGTICAILEESIMGNTPGKYLDLLVVSFYGTVFRTNS